MLSIKKKYDVLVSCMTFNHAQYIESALNGFAMQQTSFPFVCLIMDDASTDGEQNVIKAFLDKECEMSDAEQYEIDEAKINISHHKNNHNCTFVVYFLKQNLYKTDKKEQLIKSWQERCKYIAMCEGDDYWTNALKLQKQVDWLELHNNCSMCCCDAAILTPNGEESWKRYDSDCDIPTNDMILGGGLWVQTAGLVFRSSLLTNYPDYCLRCHVGDYPLQIYAALNGKVHWFAEKMISYRFACGDSWTALNRQKPYSELINGWISEINMLQGLDAYSDLSHHEAFTERQIWYISDIMREYPNNWRMIYPHFKEIVKLFSKKQAVLHFLFIHNLYPIYALFRNVKSRI